MTLSRLLYTTILYLLSPVIMLRLMYRALKSPAYAERWAERFGWYDSIDSDNVIWLHAVSVGETLAAAPLIKALQNTYPDSRLLVTCMTPTGSERIQALFGDSIEHSYAPYDMPHAVARFLAVFQPKLLIVMETELWPNTIAACAKRHIPVILANARLSEKSARGYGKITSLVKPMLQSMTSVVAQHPDDGARFAALGLPPQSLSVSGNIKFDLNLDEGLQIQADKLAAEWRGFQQRKVWLVASTHRGEDEIVLQAFKKIVAAMTTPPLLVLVPRHPERFNQVAELCGEAGFKVARRSVQQSVEQADILLGDTMGELMSFFGACDVAFVGGSLVPNGGHNMIEPAAWGVPILSGPHLFNFSEASRLLIEGRAMRVCEGAESVNSADSLAGECIEILQNQSLATEMGDAARRIAEANRGALNKLLKVIDDNLKE